jgi:protein-S-isoprenylcysteine O-methyltransferase Ste14
MALTALIVLVAWLALVAGLRTYLAYRRTGVMPLLVKAEAWSPQWWARWISTLGVGFAFAAPVAELAGFAPISFLDHLAVRYAGLAIALVGIAGTLAAQSAMGVSWRPDVDPNARSPLVTTGPFRLVRNPVLGCTATTVLGLALMVPNAFAILMVAACITGWEIQVRLVEEPYLRRVHGEAYREYAARTGRFVPMIGRLQ